MTLRLLKGDKKEAIKLALLERIKRSTNPHLIRKLKRQVRQMEQEQRENRGA